MTKRRTLQRGNSVQFTGFVLVGLASTACNLASRYLFEVAASYELALAGANIVGVLVAFYLNRWFVFKSRAVGMVGELARFTLVNLGGIVVAWTVAVLLYRQLFPALGFVWHADFVAHAVGIAVPVIPNYVAHRYWTFTRS